MKLSINSENFVSIVQGIRPCVMIISPNFVSFGVPTVDSFMLNFTCVASVGVKN